MTAARILKSDPRNAAARRVRLADLSQPTHSRFAESDFEPLAFPTETRQDSKSQSAADVLSALSSLQTAAAQLHTQRDNWLDQCQNETVRLGIAIAERLLRRTLTTDPEAVLDLVRSALESSVGAEHLRIRLHPADAELVEAVSETQPLETNSPVEFLPDASLARGDCVIETPNGQIDARQDILLQRIADELLAE